jgi:hypothetical protein
MRAAPLSPLLGPGAAMTDQGTRTLPRLVRGVYIKTGEKKEKLFEDFIDFHIKFASIIPVVT